MNYLNRVDDLDKKNSKKSKKTLLFDLDAHIRSVILLG
jgi:hypothetical protein